ncbi:hypothetical protein DF3PB_950008 [uncultured Defluviicoccus sp.]|uniref:Uncharacterized protein n=1 Tax=metagenome TaxID=256318 RepID=A0A380TL64_9ZZZZ|nr:hypothetical protein DF3PB_950008 [uncultured Defluviicoccus sp.]
MTPNRQPTSESRSPFSAGTGSPLLGRVTARPSPAPSYSTTTSAPRAPTRVCPVSSARTRFGSTASRFGRVHAPIASLWHAAPTYCFAIQSTQSAALLISSANLSIARRCAGLRPRSTSPLRSQRGSTGRRRC